MDRLALEVDRWIQTARQKHADGALAVADFDSLATVLRRPVRQRLLVLRATDPVVTAQVVGFNQYEPVVGSQTHCLAAPIAWPYNTVLDAIRDGWQVVHFPTPEGPFDDREIDVLGYEFVLQKLEICDE